MPRRNNDMRERRKHPRITRKLPLKVKAGTFDLATETQNISLSGICCQVNKYIEPMTKVRITMLLPLKLKNNKTTAKKVNCRGIVVRAERPEGQENKYDIAVFFNDMRQPDINIIQRYIENHLQPNPSSAPLDNLNRYPSGAN